MSIRIQELQNADPMRIRICDPDLYTYYEDDVLKSVSPLAKGLIWIWSIFAWVPLIIPTWVQIISSWIIWAYCSMLVYYMVQIRSITSYYYQYICITNSLNLPFHVQIDRDYTGTQVSGRGSARWGGIWFNESTDRFGYARRQYCNIFNTALTYIWFLWRIFGQSFGSA